MPVLNAGEFGFSTDTEQVYIGNDLNNIRILTENDLYTDSDVNSHLSGSEGINYISGVISIDNTVVQTTDADISGNS